MGLVATAPVAKREIVKPVTVEYLQRNKIYVPACPAVFLRLVEAVSNPNSCELPEIINKDMSLSGEVIRVANSAYYGASKRIFSVNDAVMRLGYNEVYSIAAALKAREAFSNGGKWDAFRSGMWEHAVKVATLCRLLSRRYNPKVVETLYTVGLLHDLGKLIFIELLQAYGGVSSTCQGEELIVQEEFLFGIDHAKLGGELLKSWKLPDLFCDLVAKHHEPIQPGDGMKLPREELHLANELALAWKGPFDAALKTLGDNMPAKVRELGMDQPAFFSLMNEWKKESEKLLSL
jgi:HD-like signal output (HDOD) protein